jgi:aryl-alcohol dehydrogenase-like predicted oxidoreductase
MEQLQENLASLSVELSSEILQEIDKIHQRYPNPAP